MRILVVEDDLTIQKQLKNLYLPFVDGVIVDIARELFYNKKNYIVGKKVKSQNGYKRQLS